MILSRCYYKSSNMMTLTPTPPTPKKLLPCHSQNVQELSGQNFKLFFPGFIVLYTEMATTPQLFGLI